MNDDGILLERYATAGSEAAFAELVQRHLNLVYFAALRQTHGNATLARDVTQSVFTDLARKARSLADRPVLAGWLYTSTRFAAIKAQRSESRRQTREQKAHEMHEQTSETTTAADWAILRPVIDEALHTLDEADREAVLLRYFEQWTFAEIATRLNISDDAARKRVSRALDQLHTALSKRGIASTAAALGLAFTAQSAVAAPAGLAASITAGALAKVGALSVGAAVFAFMSTAKNVAVILGAATVISTGVAVHQFSRNQEARRQLTEVSQQRDLALAKNRELAASAATAITRAAAAEEDNAQLLAAVEKARTSAAQAATIVPAKPAPVTHEMVQARYRAAQQLARTDPAAALPELLWCFDEGMQRVPSFTGVRLSFLLGEIAKIGQRVPAALEALRERRDAAQQRLLASSGDLQAAMEFGALNRTLKEDHLTLAIFDQLPADDARRKTLATSAFDTLVEARRYRDAAQSRTFSQTKRQLEMSLDLPETPNASEAMKDAQRLSLARNFAKHVEALAGAGELAQARELAGLLLAHDNSSQTQAVLQQHLARAGQPALLAAPAARSD